MTHSVRGFRVFRPLPSVPSGVRPDIGLGGGVVGTPTAGADANVITLLRTLGSVMPDHSSIGQVQCRAATGSSIDLPMTQFTGSCTCMLSGRVTYR